MKCKSTIVLLTVLILSAATTEAQKIQLGIKAGVLSNQIRFIHESDANYAVFTNNGAQFGLFSDIRISRQLSFQPHVQFALKGGEFQEIKLNTNHIEVPLNILYNANGFFAGGGPSFSYAVSGKIKSEDKELDLYNKKTAEALTLKKMEFGLNFQMGYRFNNGITILANYNPHLSNVYEGDGTMTAIERAKTKSFGFSLAYMFATNRK